MVVHDPVPVLLVAGNALMQTEGKSRKLLRIHRDDNVLIVVAAIRPGDRDTIDGHEVVFTRKHWHRAQGRGWSILRPRKGCISVGFRLAPRKR